MTATADTYARPFSAASVISPHHALEALAAKDQMEDTSYPPSPDDEDQHHTPRQHAPSPNKRSPAPRISPSGVRHVEADDRADHDGLGLGMGRDHQHRSGPSPRPDPSPTPPQSSRQRQQSDDTRALEKEFEGRMFVRALFDFEATDPSALSFQAGDIIEVITRLESGWWDGLLAGERGWFPSNFVKEVQPREIIDEVELEDELSEVPGSATDAEGGMKRNAEGSGSRERIKTPSNGTSGDNGEDIDFDMVLQRGSWGGGSFSATAGLEDLAKEMMGHDDLDEDLDGFQAAARDRKQRIQDTGAGFGADEFQLAADDRRRRQAGAAGGEMDDFGAVPSGSGRKREHTNETIKGLQPSFLPDPQLEQGERTPGEEYGGGEMDAWIPTMTPDGQVYYHNELTGEDAWELPTRLSSEDSDVYEGEEDDLFNSFTPMGGPSSAAYAAQQDDADSFRPPHRDLDLPEPWAARMTDDGRGWYYVNKLTGQTRNTPPPTSLRGVNDNLRRLSVASIPPPAQSSRPLQPSRSLNMKRRQVAEWTTKTRERMRTRPENPPRTMGYLVEMVNEALREVFEACVAGSAAEEERARADDLGSEAGVILALAREEAAEELLRVAHLSTLAALRELFSAFGYVGPLDSDPEMPRPAWVGDMTLIGSIGLLSANVHAATTSHRPPDSGMSVWAEVMRSGSKLKDVIALFPAAVTPGTTPGIQDGVTSADKEARVDADGVGRIMSGKWGFGPTTSGESLRKLDQSLVEDLQTAKMAFEATLRDKEVLDSIRLASKFRELVLSIDIASSIDIDGDRSTGGKEESSRNYAELVDQARKALMDLEAGDSLLVESCTSLLTRKDGSPNTLELLSPTVDTITRVVISVLRISSSQQSMDEQHLVLGQLGHRSPSFTPPAGQGLRPGSVLSDNSRRSRHSSSRKPSRGIEEEFLDSGEYDDESRDQAGELVSASASASASQTSLPQLARRGPSISTTVPTLNAGPGEISATSSTTSLTYQKSESDSGSQRGKRSSIMKFMRGRSTSDVEDGRGMAKPRQPSKKLAKLLGEDLSTLGQLPPPQAAPAQQVPETPWYLGDDYEPSDLLFDEKGAVRAGTLRALVARLTPYGSTDTSFFQAFMFTFRSFTSSQELLDNLLQRYYIQPPAGLNQIETADWVKQKQTPLRLRVCNTLRAWLDKYYIDKLDALLLDRIEKFAEDESRTLAAQQLKGLVQRRRRGEADVQRRIVSGGLLSPPAPLIPRVPAGRQMNVLDIAPLELARQLTILESGFFQRVQPSECLNKAWNGPDGDKVAPNVRSVIKTANILSGWVGTTCLSSKDAKQRARIMKHFIQTAMELRNLNNFSSMAAVAAGLNTAPVLRLKRSWELCSPKTQAQKAEVDKTLDSTKNFSNYKDMLKTINPPCVPFFGFWLSALTFIEDGNKDFIPASTPGHDGQGMSTSASSSSIGTNARSNGAGGPTSSTSLASTAQAGSTTANGSSTTSAPADVKEKPKQLINFFKRSLAAEILRDIQQYQSQPYNLAKSRMVYDWLMKQLEHCDRTYDLDKLYNLSLQLEPREREEERITRMLHDSGFI